MRKSILAGVSALVLCVAAPASAQFGGVVYDPSNYAQALEQVRQLQQQYAKMQEQLQTAKSTLDSVSHLPDQALNQIGQQFNTQQLRQALPTGDGVQNLLNGEQLNAQAQQFLNKNRVYQPTGDDFAAQEMTRNGQSIANQQAMANSLYQSSTARINALQGLEGQLAGAKDAKSVADISARIQQEQAYIQAQQVQAQSLQMWQAAQERNAQQRSDEQRRQRVESMIAEAKARGG
ncbi:type IV secretion system protein [Sphingomonas aurantiaca]|nr:type IV secretion system protein [Sphingomonas aurantiaca]